MKQKHGLGHDIHGLLTNFAEELNAMVQRAALERVQAALMGTSTATHSGRGRRASTGGRPMSTGGTAGGTTSGKTGKRGKRSTAQVAQTGERLMIYIKKNPGLRGEQLASVFKTDSKTIRLPLQRLIAEKKIKTKGQRRGMSYHPA
jgi:hypothetical protein